MEFHSLFLQVLEQNQSKDSSKTLKKVTSKKFDVNRT